MNNQASSNGWSKWLNTNESMVTFKVNEYDGLTLSLQLILLTDITGTERGNVFKGWFEDTSYSNTLTSYTVSGSSTATLYGLYGAVVVVTFDGNGVTPSQQNKSVL